MVQRQSFSLISCVFLLLFHWTLFCQQQVGHQPPDKIERLVNSCKLLLQKSSVSIQLLSEVLGLIVAYKNASNYGLLHYRSIEKLKTTGLTAHKGNFSGTVSLTSD